MEVSVVGLVISILFYSPDVCKGGRVHSVQSAKVEDERPTERLACGDGWKRIGEILNLAKAANAGVGSEGSRGTGVSLETAGAKREEGVDRPLRALRKRANAVSAWGGARGGALVSARRKGAPKSSRRVKL